MPNRLGGRQRIELETHAIDRRLDERAHTRNGKRLVKELIERRPRRNDRDYDSLADIRRKLIDELVEPSELAGEI